MHLILLSTNGQFFIPNKYSILDNHLIDLFILVKRIDGTCLF